MTTCLIWQVVSTIRIDDPELREFAFMRILSLTCLFYFSRVINNKNLIFYFLTITGLAQALYSIAQQSGFVESNHILFKVTGFMGNPGQMGGFQAVSLVSTLFLTQSPKNSQHLLRWGFISISILISYSILISDSRAAFLSSICGISILYHHKLTYYINHHKWSIYFAVIVAVIGVILMYYYRVDSVSARLLIWKVCISMIVQNPLFGYGTCGFNRHYMLYQADFFHKHPDSPLLHVADNAAYPYNEILHILVEQGMIGLVLFLVLLFSIFLKISDIKHAAPLITLFVFSCFSYPSYKILLAILFPILIGVLWPDSRNIYPDKTRVSLPCILLSLATIFAYKSELQQQKAVDNKQRISEKNISSISPTCENWCNIGEYYISIDDHNTARQYLKKAALMIPTRVRPNYILWKSYVSTGDVIEAEDIGRHILTQPIKVENTFTLRVKKEVQDWFRCCHKGTSAILVEDGALCSNTQSDI